MVQRNRKLTFLQIGTKPSQNNGLENLSPLHRGSAFSLLWLSDRAVYSSPPLVNDLCALIVVLAHAIFDSGHKLRVSYVKLVQLLANKADAKTTAFADWVVDEVI
jgi:superfamily II DNA helicase RecQ